MGYEFRIKTVPSVANLSEMVAPVLNVSERIIDSSLSVATSEKLGIASELTASAGWPHCCDLMIEETGALYAIGHNSVGCQIIRRFAQHLKANGYAVEIDEDI